MYQAYVPNGNEDRFTCLLTGYRSIPLLNAYSEELELASLLVKIEIVNPNVSIL